MSIRCFILTLALTLGVIVRAEEVPRLPPQPDHLVPVNPYPGQWLVRYTDELRARLELESSFLAQMVVMPSFSGEYAVRLQSAQDINPTDTSAKFWLTCSAADKNIWQAMAEGNGEKKVSIAVTKAEISGPLVERIEQLWNRMLYGTRYFETNAAMTDGTTVEFGIWQVYGKTHSPMERKSPALFIALGESLISYCKATPAGRPAAAKEIESKAAQLEQYLNKLPAQ